jgi:hypothetical protein
MASLLRFLSLASEVIIEDLDFKLDSTDAWQSIPFLS